MKSMGFSNPAFRRSGCWTPKSKWIEFISVWDFLILNCLHINEIEPRDIIIVIIIFQLYFRLFGWRFTSVQLTNRIETLQKFVAVGSIQLNDESITSLRPTRFIESFSLSYFFFGLFWLTTFFCYRPLSTCLQLVEQHFTSLHQPVPSLASTRVRQPPKSIDGSRVA